MSTKIRRLQESQVGQDEDNRMNQLKSVSNIGFDHGAYSKLNPGLRKAIDESKLDPSREWPVMILLGGGTSRRTGTKLPAEFAKQAAEAFEQEAAELIQLLSELSRQPVQVFWINRSLAASLRLDALLAVARRPEVQQIMLMVKHKALI